MRWHYGPWVAALAFIAGIFLMAGAGAYIIRQQDHVNLKLCQSAVANRAAVRSTWLGAERLVLSSTQAAQREQTRLFFSAVLRPIPPLECVNNKPVPRRTR